MLLFPFFILTVYTNEPWTKEVKSLEDTIKKAYAIIENDDDKAPNYIIVLKHINFSIIAICEKVHYLNHTNKKPAELTRSLHVIYHNKKLLTKQ